MSSSRLRSVLVVLLALAVLFPFFQVRAQDEPVPNGDAAAGNLFLPLITGGAAEEFTAGVETVCTLPVGDAGIHYAGEATPEMEAWGPSALVADTR